MMKRKILSLILACAMTVGLLAGCGKDGNGEGKDAGKGTGKQGEASVNGIDITETYEATMVLIGNQQADQDKVLEKINEILMEEINTKLKIVMLSTGDFTTQLPLMLQGGDKVDIVPVINSMAGPFINNRMIIDLSSYLEQYGSNVKEGFKELGEDLLYTGCINDFMFGLPVVHSSVGISTVCMRKDWLEEAGFSKEDIKDADDMDAVYEKVQENHPDAVMLWMYKGMGADSKYEVCDPLSDYNGVLLDNGEKPEVENWFASDDYKEIVERHYEWNKKGWISKDAATTTDQPNSAVQAGRAFSFYTPGGADAEAANSISCGNEMVCAQITPGQLTTTGFSWNTWGIAQASENPERAFLLLDYLYGSKEITNLINFGIEGEHYVVGDDGLYHFPEGVDSSNATYAFHQGWELPNQFLGGVWEDSPADLWEQQLASAETSKRSCALGFAYDSSSLSNEIAAISNVRSQYMDALNAGSVDPEKELPKFLEALDQAGMQKVIEEKQKQLDEWLASSGK